MAKGFKDTTKVTYGEHRFDRTSTPVRMHSRAMPKARGGPLTAKARDALPKSDFGLPSERKFPMPDKSHAANAKARASQQAARGALSEGAKAKIDAKANAILHRAKGGSVSATDVHKHERHMHPGKPLTKLARGGAVPAHCDTPRIKG